MPLNPRLLILSLLLGAESQTQAARPPGLAAPPATTLGVRELLASCGLFGVSDNGVRVALARAVAAGLLVTPERGVYALGPQARPLADEVGRWHHLAGRLLPWSGDWLAVHVGASGRSDRPALRARERAFDLLGLAELERGLHLRPDNLAGGADALRARLHALLPEGAAAGTVFVLRGLSAPDDAQARSLWDTAALDTRYRDTTAGLAAWLDQARGLPLERAARECFELGHAAIRQLVFDPLLPAPLVDDAARQRFIHTVTRFDNVGKGVWQHFLAASRQGTTTAPLPALETLA